jgi:hypothetical protein
VEDIPPDEALILQCGHGYHRACIQQWGSMGAGAGNRACPECRAPFTPADIEKLDGPARALWKAIERADPGAVRRILSGSDIVNTRYDVGGTLWTYLIYAALREELEIVRILARAGADVNARTKNLDDDLDKGDTALHNAAKYAHLDVLRWLVLEGGAEVDVANDSGDTPLHQAARFAHMSPGGMRHLDAVRFLVENGASPSRTNNAGLTPLEASAAFALRMPPRLRQKFDGIALFLRQYE